MRVLCLLFLVLLSALAEAKGQTKVLRAFVGVQAPASFYPNKAAGGISYDTLNQIFDNLFWIDYAGNLQPALATGFKRLGPTQVEIQLRKGVRFHNGEPFDSRSVKLTFDLFTDPHQAVANRFYGRTIKSVEIKESHKVVIHTAEPDPLLIYRLAIVGEILPAAYFTKVGEKGFAKRPVGTGAFSFKQLVPGKLTLQANPHYWQGRPSIDVLEFHYLKNVETAVAALSSGSIDFMSRIPGKDGEQVYSNPNLTLMKQLTRYSIMMLVNTKKEGPLRNLEIRKSLISALNFEDIVRYGYFGNGKVASSLTVEGEPYWTPGLKPIVWNPQLIRSFLPDLEKYTFRLQVTQPYELVGRMISKQMEALGLKVDVRYGSDVDETREVLEKNQQGKAPEIDFLLSYCAHKFATGAFPLSVLMHSEGNWSMTRDRILDALLDEALSEFEEKSQTLKFQKVAQHIYDNALVFPGFQLQDLYGMKKGIRFRSHITGYVYFKDIGWDS